MQQQYREVSGFAQVANGSATAALIAAQGSGKKIRVVGGVINITTAAVGGGGLVEIQNGSNAIIRLDANAVNSVPFYFDGQNGYPLTDNTALNVVVTGAVTTQATANVSVVGYVVG